MPLKWNIHFWLQSTLCDHERVQWDFVGMLNATFHDQVHDLIRVRQQSRRPSSTLRAAAPSTFSSFSSKRA